MSMVIDSSNIFSLTSNTTAQSKAYNLARTDFVSYQLNYSGTTQSAAVMASASNITAAVQSTAVLTVSNYASVSPTATITIKGTVYTNGVDFTVGTSNNASATSIAAIATLPAGITASATGAVVTFVNTAYGTVGNTNTITTSDPTDLTITASPFSNGVDALFTKTAHGLLTGTVGQMTTSSALPTGLSTSTNYYVIALSANTFAVASSLANASAGTRIQFTTTGTGNQTFTPTSLSQVVKLQQSNDGVTYFDVSGVTVTITGSGNTLWLVSNPPSLWHKIVVTPTSGALNLAVVVCNRNNSITGSAS